MFCLCLHIISDNTDRSLVECLFLYLIALFKTGESCKAFVMINTLVSPSSVVCTVPPPLLSLFLFVDHSIHVTQFYILFLIISLSMCVLKI